LVTKPPFDIQPILQGELVLLRPLCPGDLEELYAVASDPDIWAMHPYRDRHERPVFEAFFDEAIASQGAFAIFDRATGKMIGSTRFANYNEQADEIEIGWTFFATSHWRGGFNRETKALMLRHIFAHVGTVVFQIGAYNYRSRNAVERLGAQLSGHHIRHHNGQDQDYVTYRLTRADAATGALAVALAA
jgi:N-acetyltransferase